MRGFNLAVIPRKSVLSVEGKVISVVKYLPSLHLFCQKNLTASFVIYQIKYYFCLTNTKRVLQDLKFTEGRDSAQALSLPSRLEQKNKL